MYRSLEGPVFTDPFNAIMGLFYMTMGEFWDIYLSFNEVNVKLAAQVSLTLNTKPIWRFILIYRTSVFGLTFVLTNTRLKAKKIHGLNSCIVISIYLLDIPLIKKATEYRYNW